MTKKLKWRLAEKPTPQSVIDLANAGFITKEEAKEILFTSETEEKVSEDSLKSEIKFLRELVDQLAKGNQSKIVETIRYIDRPYRQYGWYAPYTVYCGNTATTLTSYGTGTATNAVYSSTSNNLVSASAGLSSISTF